MYSVFDFCNTTSHLCIPDWLAFRFATCSFSQVPFLASAGLAGFLTVTIVILTSCLDAKKDQRGRNGEAAQKSTPPWENGDILVIVF